MIEGYRAVIKEKRRARARAGEQKTGMLKLRIRRAGGRKITALSNIDIFERDASPSVPFAAYTSANLLDAEQSMEY